LAGPRPISAADTIFALSSGRPPAAIAVVRVSGPRAHQAGAALAGALPEPRRAAVRSLRSGGGELLDRCLVLRFDAPGSATGEDLVEFHCHGGRAVTDAVLAALATQDGLRPARPGEFTRRGFENGRIDLTEAEGLADLLQAETEQQRRAALAMAEGGLRNQIDAWRNRLVELSARAEAAIDYVDEADLDPGLLDDCRILLAELAVWLQRPRAELLKDGVKVVIAGPPNAGKSSLLNAIAGSEKAIVTPVPGTTRDRIAVPVALNGVPLVLTDTAGIRDTEETVERIGVVRAKEEVAAADILLWLGDPVDAPEAGMVLKVHSRCDLDERGAAPAESLPVSALTGEGLSELMKRVVELAQSFVPAGDEIALNRRQAAHLTQAASALERGVGSNEIVLLADDLRVAREALDRLTGLAGVEDVLDALFARFCLGK
jgi:tRNA modification GTPase